MVKSLSWSNKYCRCVIDTAIDQIEKNPSISITLLTRPAYVYLRLKIFQKGSPSNLNMREEYHPYLSWRADVSESANANAHNSAAAKLLYMQAARGGAISSKCTNINGHRYYATNKDFLVMNGTGRHEFGLITPHWVSQWVVVSYLTWNDHQGCERHADNEKV